MPGAGRARYRGRPAAWFWRLQATSVRSKILVMVLMLTLVLGLGVALQVRTTTRGVLEEELDLIGGAVSSDLAARVVDPLLLGDAVAVFELASGTVRNHDDVVYAFVTDADANVVAHSFGGAGFPVQLLEVPDAPGPFVFDSELGRIHHFRAGILDGQAGTVAVGLSEDRVESIISGVTIQMLLVTLAVALAGVGTAVLLTKILVRPILDLVRTTRRVGGGDLSARAHRWASDEIGVLAEAFNVMVEDLEASHMTIAEKEAARERLLGQLISAQEEERKRIARELHDGVGQSLNSLVLGLSTLETENGDQAAHIDELRHATLETLTAVRQISRQLRPSVLDDLGLADAVDLYAAELSGLMPQFRIDTQIDIDRRLPTTIETALYRIVQEGMTNAVRHSDAALLSVIVTARDGRLQVIIEDDGVGFDVESTLRHSNSVGLHAIQERAELIGGRARFESGAGGTAVFVEVPI